MVAAERAESLDVLVAGFAAGLAGDVIERALGVDRVVENDRVDDQAERAELFFLALVVGWRSSPRRPWQTSRARPWRPSPRLSWTRTRRRKRSSLQ